jgi:indolepyruvate ferredoxin oxidoreductase beta subunit
MKGRGKKGGGRDRSKEIAMTTKNVLIVGVGGQGVVLASNILSEAAMISGYDVKKNEAHGQSQRSGSVSSHIRYGTRVYSPVIGEGEADIILAFEELEALRWAHYLKAGGTIIVNKQRIYPASVISGIDSYPDDPVSLMKDKGIEVISIDGTKMAQRIGNPVVISTLFMGVAAAFLTFAEKAWKSAITTLVPEKHRDLNLNAFAEGRKLATAIPGR